MKYKVTSIIDTQIEASAWSVSSIAQTLLHICFKVESCVAEPIPEEQEQKEPLVF